jgi:hypothetical protein
MIARARARRRHNSLASAARAVRLDRVCEIISQFGIRHGLVTHTAKQLNVSLMTASRDVRLILHGFDGRVRRPARLPWPAPAAATPDA